MADSKIRVCRDDDMKLNEICEVYSGYALKAFNDAEDGFPVIKIGNIFMDGTLNLEECQYTTDGVNEKYYSQRGDIYIALSGATTGKIGIMDASEKYVINQRVGIVRQKSDDIPQEYIKYFLLRQTDRILQEAAGCAQPNISPRQIAEYVVPDTSQEKMQEICEVLDRIKKIIDSRKVQISALDNLIKARFVELFGNPEINDMHWDEHKLSDELSVIGGYAFKSDSFQEDGIPVLRIGNINAGVFRPINLVFWKKDDTLFKYLMYPGDLVMSLTGTVGKDDYGNVCILGSEYEMYYLNQRNAKLELKDGLDKYYLAELLKFPQIKKRLTGISRGVRQANISNKDILDLSVPIPPMKLQQQFADFVTQVDKSKVKVQKALDETQKLFDSLMQQYFG